MRFTIADYNLSVLEMATVPNLLLTWYFAQAPVTLERKGDLEITQDLLATFLNDLLTKRISIRCISGAWGDAFSELISQGYAIDKGEQAMDTMILASETIYSPSSTLHFAGVLTQILQEAKYASRKCQALLGAKRIYFGVGGGVDEFLATLDPSKSTAQTVWESPGHGVGRVILHITGV